MHIYLGVSAEAINAAFVQDLPNPRLVYFVSRVLQLVETRYQQVEKVALALLNVVQRLRPYFQSHQVVIRTDYPISKILRKPDLAGRMVGWAVELSKFGLRYEPRGSVKGQHLADFVVELSQHTPTEQWNLYVDCVVGQTVAGAGIVLEGPKGFLLEQSLVFKFKALNNQAEYEVLIAGLQLAKDMGASSMISRTDSRLVVGQMNGEFQVKDDQLLLYFDKASTLVKDIPRQENTLADLLSKLSEGKEKGRVTTIIRQVLAEPSVECLAINGLEAPD